MTGSEAYTYANDTFDTEVEIQTNGLRIRSSADPDASVLAAVSTGMTFPLDADAETVDGMGCDRLQGNHRLCERRV